MFLWSFDLLWSRRGDIKLHVNFSVPSGSDESDCTPGILCLCRSACVFDRTIRLCATVGIGVPTSHGCHRDHGVMSGWACVCFSACLVSSLSDGAVVAVRVLASVWVEQHCKADWLSALVRPN